VAHGTTSDTAQGCRLEAIRVAQAMDLDVSAKKEFRTQIGCSPEDMVVWKSKRIARLPWRGQYGRAAAGCARAAAALRC
jgi:hypothetical protein